jgi:broad specificity phosphatase PhoE
MRLVLIRHGENQDNVVMARIQLGFEKKMFAEVTDGFLAMQKYSTPNSDGPLTADGLKQAEALGLYWGEIFKEYKRKTKGNIYMYSSPILRAMETAEPLSKKLNIPVTVCPDLAEMPALVSIKDRAKYQVAIGKLEYEQKHVELRELLNNIEWERCGMSGNEILKRFPSYRLQQKDTNAFGNLEERWCNLGIESEGKRENRCRRVISWFYDLRDTLNSEDMVIVIGHGRQIGFTLNGLFHNFNAEYSFGSADNTAVTSIIMEKTKADESAERERRGLGKRPLTFFPPGRWQRAVMEFNNRVDHLIALLGQNRSRGFFSFPNFVNAPSIQSQADNLPEFERIMQTYIKELHASKL